MWGGFPKAAKGSRKSSHFGRGSVCLQRINHWATQSALTEWLSGLSFTNKQKTSGTRMQPKSFFRFFWDKKGKQVERTTIKECSTRGSDVECATRKERTTWWERTIQRKKQALIRGLINSGGCCRWEGYLSPKVLLLFVYKGWTNEALSQQILVCGI